MKKDKYIIQIPSLYFFVFILFFSGCGKPKKEGGPQGAFPAVAVVALVENKSLADEIEIIADLEAKEQITLVSELDAVVTAIHFSDGDEKLKGDILFTLDDVRTKALLKEAKSSHSLAQLNYKRNQELLGNQTISQAEFDQSLAEFDRQKALLEKAEDEHSKTQIKTPFTGIIGEKKISVGQYVNRGQTLAELIQLDPLDIVVDIPERYLEKVKIGGLIKFKPDAYNDQNFDGVINYIAPSVNRETRTLRVKAKLDNSTKLLRPGMFGRAFVVFEVIPDSVLIPEASVMLQGGLSMVIIVDSEGKSQFRPVILGKRFSGKVIVEKGLSVGEKVVVEGHQKMGPGMNVIASPESATYGVNPGPLFPSPEPSQNKSSDESNPS